MIGKTVVSHYKILEKLGEGGMGVVYRAEDTRLKRPVALKFLRHEAVGDSVEKKRFLYEAQAAVRLDHPNICSIYEVDHIVGQSFIAMAYVDGPSLRTKLEDGPLEIEEVLDIARQIAEGLNEAHEKGIVHRDIKPANIMLTTKRQVKIMDFGLAKLSGMTRVTKTGSTVGTMAYMSPEQARGEEVGRSTDIWSFGVVLYEMLTGRLPFQGEYEAAVLYAILNRELDSVSTLRPDTPPNVQRIIRKSLEKEPVDRYSSMSEIIADLEETKPISGPEPEPKKSIVVLPFVNMSPDPDQEYFSDGLTEEIITDLSHVGDLLVISRNSAMTFKGTAKRTSEIAKIVNVRYVLEGSVRKAGNNLRITAQLIDATTDVHIWAEKYRGILEDVFDIQEEVSRKIVDALRVTLSPEEKERIAERPIDDIQAYQCYLKARQEMWKWTEDGLERAKTLIQSGLNILGENELFHIAMGTIYAQYINFAIKKDPEYLQKAEECVQKAFALNAESTRGYFLKGFIEVWRGKIQDAVREFKLALSIDPNDSEILNMLAYEYAISGKGFAAGPLFKKALEIDPLNPLIYGFSAAASAYEGDFATALERCTTFLQMNPDNPLGRVVYAIFLAYNHRYDEAFAHIDRHIKDSPQSVWAQLGVFLKYALQGNKDMALQSATDELKEAMKWDNIYPVWMAECYALIGEKEEAIEWIEEATRWGFINYDFFTKHDPFLENIREERRFLELVERIRYRSDQFEV